MRVTENVTVSWQWNIRVHKDEVTTTLDCIYFFGISQAVCNSLQSAATIWPVVKNLSV